MCGIFGLIQAPAGSVAVAAAALARIRHRGPDDEGMLLGRPGEIMSVRGDGTDPSLPLPHWKDAGSGHWPIILGHRRLSILDLSSGGHQPMSWENDRYWITYNGEVYNYLEIRTELEAAGAVFQSGSDTEVILAAYARWGIDCVHRFTGMWAFAIWDRHEDTLFLARDPFGIKPLHYAVTAGGFAFCSEVAGLLELPWIARVADPQAVYDYLAWGQVEGPEGATMFKHIREMPPATRGVFHLGDPVAFKPERYWNIDLSRRTKATYEEGAAELRAKFLRSIELHLRADVPVGAALSGGIDSSAIVGAMRLLGGPALQLHTFSYIPDDVRISEAPWIQMAAEANRAQQHVTRADPLDWINDLDALILCQGQPFGSASIYAQHRVFSLVKDAGIKVSLDGQGPDEMFAGYHHYRRDWAMALKARGHWRGALRMAAVGSAQSSSKLLGQLFLPSGWLPAMRRIFGSPPVPRWMDSSWLNRTGISVGRQHPPLAGPDALRQSLKRSLLETSIPSLLRYEDRNSMHFSVESRVPYLTTDIAEFALSLPEEALIGPDGTTKRIMRTAMKGLAPQPILERRDKVGFETPESNWVRQQAPWVRSLVTKERSANLPILNSLAMPESLNRILSGQESYQSWVWRVLNFIRWAELNKVHLTT